MEEEPGLWYNLDPGPGQGGPGGNCSFGLAVEGLGEAEGVPWTLEPGVGRPRCLWGTRMLCLLEVDEPMCSRILEAVCSLSGRMGRTELGQWDPGNSRKPMQGASAGRRGRLLVTLKIWQLLHSFPPFLSSSFPASLLLLSFFHE